MVIIVWAVYLEENADESYLIATGVMGAATIGNQFCLSLKGFLIFHFFNVLIGSVLIANPEKKL